jgi:hypothetical protein
MLTRDVSTDDHDGAFVIHYVQPSTEKPSQIRLPRPRKHDTQREERSVLIWLVISHP